MVVSSRVIRPGKVAMPGCFTKAPRAADGLAGYSACVSASASTPRMSVGNFEIAWLANMPEIVLASNEPRFCPFWIQSPVR